MDQLNEQGRKTHKFRDINQTAKLQLKELLSGESLSKSYNEFRVGFRHPFSSAMMIPSTRPEIERISLLIDKCLELMTGDELKDIITYDPTQESTIPRRQVVVQLFQRNLQRAKMVNTGDNLEQTTQRSLAQQIIGKIIDVFSDEKLIAHRDLLNFVYCATGARALRDIELTLRLSFEKRSERRLLQFHTCFNTIDIPVTYVLTLSDEQIAEYVKDCCRLALESGFGMA